MSESSPKPPGESTGLLWNEEGLAAHGRIAEVAPLVPVLKTYSFTVPAPLAGRLDVGDRVIVSLGKGRRRTEGIVVRLSEGAWDGTLRPVEDIADQASRLTPELIALGRRVAAHYVSPLGQTLAAMMPTAVRRGRGMKTVRYVRLRPCAANDADLSQTKPARRISSASQQKRARIIEILERAGGESSVRFLQAASGCTEAILKGLARDGVIELRQRRQESVFDSPTAARTPDFELTVEQGHAANVIRQRLDAERFSVTLLHGVSGSGKTEVYIHAMRHALVRGGQAILLIPEIVLTTQLVARLSGRFEEVAVLHSGMTESHRSIAWRRIESGEARIVIGTRSAVFAPCPRLALICVDEEQEDSYKNLQTPRFHVRDVAIFRAHALGIPVVLGSATPSLESWHNCSRREEYTSVLLRRRVSDRPLPKIDIVDMNTEQEAVGGERVFSRLLERKLGETLNRGEQAIILLNRRGYATRLWCPQCRQSIQCPRCNIGLVAHEARGQAICHHCFGRIDLPRVCPTLGCGTPLLRRGMGTQRVEEALQAHFPAARLRRVDSDTMHHRDLYVRLVEDFEARRIDVLVGTQMIAKGLDFPHVSLVGVIAAESIAATADFRNQEKLFALITQVAGRAGRGELPGEVVVQTTLMELPALRWARNHDYEGFAERELELRRRLGYPPLRKMARIVLVHAREETCLRDAETLAEALRTRIERSQSTMGEPGDAADVLGPAPCTRPRLRDRYRCELLLRADRSSRLERLLAELRASPPKVSSKTSVDVDPVAFD